MPNINPIEIITGLDFLIAVIFILIMAGVVWFAKWILESAVRDLDNETHLNKNQDEQT